jgi:hypothetical protein
MQGMHWHGRRARFHLLPRTRDARAKARALVLLAQHLPAQLVARWQLRLCSFHLLVQRLEVGLERADLVHARRDLGHSFKFRRDVRHRQVEADRRARLQDVQLRERPLEQRVQRVTLAVGQRVAERDRVALWLVLDGFEVLDEPARGVRLHVDVHVLRAGHDVLEDVVHLREMAAVCAALAKAEWQPMSLHDLTGAASDSASDTLCGVLQQLTGGMQALKRTVWSRSSPF